MNTSIRGRGKWGDFLVALIPVSWCCNILINSNFILRMIEWQNESSLFTIRIQGKQWYWVYKYDPNTAQAVINIPKNIGNNKWRVTSGQESYNADTYYQAIHLAAHIEFQDSYSKFTKKIDTHRKNLSKLNLLNDKTLMSSVLQHTLISDLNPNISDETVNLLENNIFSSTNLDNFLIFPIQKNNPISSLLSEEVLDIKSLPVKNFVNYSLSNTSNISLSDVYYNSNYFNNTVFNNFFDNKNFNIYYDFLQLDETTDADSNSRHYLITQPFRLVKGILNQHVLDILQKDTIVKSNLHKLLFLNTKFSKGGESLADKELMPETFWGFRQKKYKRTKKFKFKPEVIYDPVSFTVIGNKAPTIGPNLDIAGLDLYTLTVGTAKNLDSNDMSFKQKSKQISDTFNYRLATKINRYRSELVPVTLARRLLRTKRTLVLPAHVNLTLITNSYDVVHSWFVPGLGLKLDCVPGRSTHHTFYIDNIGFYYGQCAEICGRYHHHMPIRLCALPFEHFVVWWQSKGLARMNRTSEISSNKYLQHSFNNQITREKLIFKMN